MATPKVSFAELELGPKMQLLNERERKFVWHFIVMDENQTDAARLAGYTDTDTGAIRVAGHVLAHRPRVLDAMEEVGRLSFRGFLGPALKRTKAIMDEPDHPDHARTVMSVLSRLGFGEKSGVDVNVSGQVTVNHTDEAVEQLRALKDLGVPHEKLVEIFGFSGLARYEAMLAKAPPRLAGPVIEGEVVETTEK